MARFCGLEYLNFIWRRCSRVALLEVSVFDRDDGIGALRQLCAGHDARGFTLRKRNYRVRSCGYIGDHAQAARRSGRGVYHIRSADGESVHGRVVEEGQVSRGGNILCKHALCTLNQWQSLSCNGVEVGKDALTRFSYAEQRHVCLTAARLYPTRRFAAPSPFSKKMGRVGEGPTPVLCAVLPLHSANFQCA